MLKLSTLCISIALGLSACGGGDKAPADKPADSSTAPAATSGNSDMDKQLDTELAQMKPQLPVKMGNAMEMTSIEREGKTVVYTYTFLTDAVTKATFKPEEGKKAAAGQLCANRETKKYFDGGYGFKFNYIFKDKSNVEVPFAAGDCK